MDHVTSPSCGYNPQKTTTRKSKESEQTKEPHKAEEPTQLENGRWNCNHKCKDKAM
jgi:hypothetical protein